MRRMVVIALACVEGLACSKHEAAGPGGAKAGEARAATVASADALWAMAPANAALGVVVADGTAATMIERLRDLAELLARSPQAAPFVKEARDKLAGAAFDPLDAASWQKRGLSPAQGGAVFLDGDGEPVLIVLPVIDRAAFRAAAHGKAEGERDTIQDMTCGAVGKRYACARQAAALDAAAHASGGPLGAAMKAEPASARGDVELVVNLDTLHVDGIAVAQKAFADSHVVAAGLRLDAGGVTLRAHLPGKPIGPAAMFAARKPGPALGKFLGGAASVMRVHVAPSVLLMGFRGAPPPVIELASQLTGDFLIFGRGRGPVAGVLLAQVKDGGAASKALQAMCQPVGELQLSWHDGVCAAVPPDLSSDLKLGPLPTFDLRVAGDQLVYTIGSDAHEAPGTAADVAGSPEAREIIEGDVTYAAWARGLDFFAALPPEAVAALGADDPELRTGLEVTSAVLAGIYEAGFAVAVRDDGLHILGRVTGFGGDPAPARQAMDAAMTLRLHGDLAGYRAAVVKAGADNPGTLVARQAQLVKDGYPVLGVGVAVVAAVAIPPFMKYIRKAKTSEAEVNVRRMNEGLRAYAAAHDGALPPSAPMTPKAGSCCAQPGQKCAADPAAWQLPAWQALRFSVDDPHYYSYELVTSGSAFTARAMGDLDCDGVFSTFELTGTVQADGSVIGGAGLFKDRELE